MQDHDRLFTPGPLCTTMTVKQAMLKDYGSRDPTFVKYIKNVRLDLLKIANVDEKSYTTVIIQGSGTFGVESTITTSIPRSEHKLLVVSNGVYGERIEKMAMYQSINYEIMKFDDNEAINVDKVIQKIKDDTKITHLAVIHSETTSGSINPIDKLGKQLKQINPNIVYIVDAMSSFGAYDIKTQDWGIDFLVASSNKNLQGIPGFSFMIARLDLLLKCKGNARSLSLDAYDQYMGLEGNGQFRFTPPTHVIVAMNQAIKEFFDQGGIEARHRKYSENQSFLSQQMQELGFKLYIDKEIQGCIITTFIQPEDEKWDFNEFYDFLAQKKILIYPGKLAKKPSFRIGSIGELQKSDFEELLQLTKEFLQKKGIKL